MNLEDIELHDAVIDSVNTNYRKQTVSVAVRYYPDQKDKKRVSAKVVFSGVERLSEVSDFRALSENKTFGNISYWHPADGEGTTYFYLTEGIVAITAKAIEFKIDV
jgi:hypothetical protein